MASKWQCDDCNECFSSKDELVEHLNHELMGLQDSVSTVIGQLEELGGLQQ